MTGVLPGQGLVSVLGTAVKASAFAPGLVSGLGPQSEALVIFSKGHGTP